jgi:hypothetical protein
MIKSSLKLFQFRVDILSDFSTIISWVTLYLIYLMNATCPAHLMLLYFATVITFCGDRHKRKEHTFPVRKNVIFQNVIFPHIIFILGSFNGIISGPLDLT